MAGSVEETQLAHCCGHGDLEMAKLPVANVADINRLCVVSIASSWWAYLPTLTHCAWVSRICVLFPPRIAILTHKIRRKVRIFSCITVLFRIFSVNYQSHALYLLTHALIATISRIWAKIGWHYWMSVLNIDIWATGYPWWGLPSPVAFWQTTPSVPSMPDGKKLVTKLPYNYCSAHKSSC